MPRTVSASIMIAGMLATMALTSCADEVTGSAKSTSATATKSVASSPANVNDGLFKIGEDVKFDGIFIGKVTRIRDLAASGEGLPADNGNRYVGVEIVLTNSGTDAEIFTPLLQAELKDPEGKVHDATPLSGHKPDAPNGEIKPKQTVDGMVVFEIPDKYTFNSGAAAGFVFLFKGPPGDREKAEIRLG